VLAPPSGEEVKSPSDTVAFRQSLLRLLEAGPADEDRLLEEFEKQRKPSQPLYSSLLYILTHLNFSERTAVRHWERIRAHRERLTRDLGRDAGLRVAILDYFVNVNRELKNPKVIEISIYQRTERDALTDGLTGLYNHGYLMQALRREVLRAKRHDLKLSVAMFDLDDFKKVNDSHGHVEGDRVLVKSAALIRDCLREIDIAARYGGEEFAIVLPETPRVGAHLVAERIRQRIEEQFRSRRRDAPRVSVSGGVATFPEDATTAEDLLRRSDEGLYRSKAEGKNRITMVGRERRRHGRVSWGYSVTLKAHDGERSRARAKNVSAGGLLVSLRRPVPIGSHVSLVVRPEGGSPMGLRGEVVRVDAAADGRVPRFDVGVRLFADPAQAQALVLRRVDAAPVPG
jgi:diguanylate cyclase (GGDEF)-like protein